MSIFEELNIAVHNVWDVFFASDTDVMSRKVKQILANPADKEKYLNALKEIKALEEKGEHGEKTIKLSTAEELTLTT
ncbi:hypothetical protein [Pedobacter aquatilis]|uniref:hypothetical protein n=1 Tax=Pedobacter aquatilis TaxID=351343 RepID=UPI00292FA6B9|nr:hypothetical protein [Pedobacter aquatilis]